MKDFFNKNLLSAIHILNPFRIYLWKEVTWNAETAQGMFHPVCLFLSHTHTCIMHHQTPVPYILYNIYKKPLHQSPKPHFTNPLLTATFPISYDLSPHSLVFFAILPKPSYNPLILFTMARSRPDITLQKLPCTLQSA
jgi:hypothetical protein